MKTHQGNCLSLEHQATPHEKNWRFFGVRIEIFFIIQIKRQCCTGVHVGGAGKIGMERELITEVKNNRQVRYFLLPTLKEITLVKTILNERIQ